MIAAFGISKSSMDRTLRQCQAVPAQPTLEQLNADPHLCRFTLVFDREAYSPMFFLEMWKKHRIAAITSSFEI